MDVPVQDDLFLNRPGYEIPESVVFTDALRKNGNVFGTQIGETTHGLAPTQKESVITLGTFNAGQHNMKIVVRGIKSRQTIFVLANDPQTLRDELIRLPR